MAAWRDITGEDGLIGRWDDPVFTGSLGTNNYNDFRFWFQLYDYDLGEYITDPSRVGIIEKVRVTITYTKDPEDPTPTFGLFRQCSFFGTLFDITSGVSYEVELDDPIAFPDGVFCSLENMYFRYVGNYYPSTLVSFEGYGTGPYFEGGDPSSCRWKAFVGTVEFCT